MDTIEGGAGNDIIYAQYSYSVYSSGVSNPYAYSGGVKADGGEGVDLIVVNLSHIPEGLTLDWRDPSKPINLSDGTSIRNVERLYVTTGDGDDTLYTGRDTEWIFTQGGNDTVVIDGINPKDVDGRQTYKLIELGAGDDQIFLTTDINPEQFQLTGGDGFDTLIADYRSRATPVTIALPLDFEALEAQGGSGGDLLIGAQIGANKLFGHGGNDNLMGGTKDDVLSGGAGYDQIFGYDGNDVIEGDDEDSIYAGNGDDRVVLRSLGTNSGSAAGGEGIDTLSASGDLTQFKYTGFEILGADLGSQNLRISAEALNAFSSVEAQAITLTTSGKVGTNFSATIGAGQLTGSTGDDTIDLARLKTAWTVRGGNGNDTITTGSGRDTLRGERGDDVLDGGAGADVMDGGAGADTYYVDDAGDRVIESMKDGGEDRVYASVNWSLEAGQAVEFLYADAGTRGITLKGNERSNYLISGDGSDRLEGGAGNDYYYVNNSRDQVIEVVNGGEDDVVFAAGDWTLAEDTYVEHLVGFGSTAHKLTGNSADNFLYGGMLYGAEGICTLAGRKGDDTYYVDQASDRVIEARGEGFDGVATSVSYALAAGQEIELLYAVDSLGLVGGRASINLTGNEFEQGLQGNDGNNVLDGRGGADIMSGAGGNDTYIVDHVGDQVIEVPGGGADTVRTSVSFKIGVEDEIETLRTISDAATTRIDLTGNAFANTLIGNAGNNRLDGGGGIDRLQGLGGNDTYVVDHASDVVIEAAGQGSDTVITTVSYRLAAKQQIEVLQTADANGKAALKLTGNEFGNKLVGNAGANVLDGGAGIDEMRGGAGNDTYRVDNARDIVIEAAGQGTDTVVTTVSYRLAEGQQVEILQTADAKGTVALKLTGNAIANKIIGNAGNNVIDGGGGIDEMRGGTGNDTYIVDDARDVVVEAVGQGRDTVAASVSYGLKGGQEVEVLRLLGSGHNDLTGNEFGQSLTGNAGNNILNGGLGADLLTGGKGADTFVFASALGTSNVDRIADFAVDDGFWLSKSVFAALAPGQLAARAFKTLDTAKIDADDRILYKQSTGELFYDADGSGKAAAVKFAVLDNKAVLTHADFLIV